MAELDLVDQMLVDQARRYDQFGTCPPVEEYLAAHPGLREDVNAQAMLALNEYALRQRQQEPPTREVFFQRFPAIAADLEIMFEINEGLESLEEEDESPTLAGELGDTLVDSVPITFSLPGFDILRKLGEGAMGVVYLAHQVQLHRRVALKLLRSPGAAGREEHSRLRSEADALAKLHHPNIVGIHDSGEVGGLPYLVLEFVEGDALSAWWKRQEQSPRLAAMVIERLARAIHFAHTKGIVHRDLKPGNVLMGGNGDEPKITDFGLAKYYHLDAGHTHTGAVLGTPDYMAPEQAEGRIHDIGPHTDIYALGAILYELLAGTPPFRRGSLPDTLTAIKHDEAKSPSQWKASVPRDLETICLKCLNKNPARRYASAEALADDLQRFLDGRPIEARRVSRAERLVMWVRRNPSDTALLATIVGLFLVSFGLVTWKWLEANEHKNNMDDVSYFDKIALADQSFHANHVQRAIDLLQECPEARRGWEWSYLYRLCHAAPVICDQGLGKPLGARFSKDGSLVAAWSGLDLMTYDAATGRTWWQARALGASFVAGAWHPQGGSIAVADEKGVVRLFEADTGKVVQTIRAHAVPVKSLAFGPTGETLASGDHNGVIHLWDTSGKLLHIFDSHQRAITGLAFHPQKPLLYSTSDDHQVKVWDLDTGLEREILCGDPLPLRALAIHPNGRHLITATTMQDSRLPTQGSVSVWDLATGKLVRTLWTPAGMHQDVAISPDGNTLAVCATETVHFWRFDDFKELTPIRLQGTVGTVDFSVKDQIATADENGVKGHAATAGSVRLWSSNNRQQPPNLRKTGGSSILALALHPTKRQLTFGDGSGKVEMLDLDTGNKIGSWPAPTDDPVWSLAYSPDGSFLAAGRLDKTIQLGRTDGAAPEILRGHTDRVYSVAFSSDGKTLYSGSTDCFIKLWDVATRKELPNPMFAHQRGIRRVAFHGSQLVSIGQDHALRVWDPALRQEVNSWLPHGTFGAASVAFHPDGRTIATGADGHEANIHFWDFKTGNLLATGKGHSRKVAHVAFSPDGKRLISTSDDRTIRLWEPTTGRLILTLNGHKAATTIATFTHDGHSIISTSWDGTIRVWDGRPFSATSSVASSPGVP